MVIKVTPAMVMAVALANTGKRYTIRQFKTLFGVSPLITAIAWELMLLDPRTIELRVELKDLLKAQHFLNCYTSETELCKLFKVTEKTFRDRCKPALKILSDLNTIEWEDRKQPNNRNHKALTSVDGTDCQIFEQTPFDGKWCSHKFKGPGLRYEVAICIVTGHMVWIFGGFPCGSHPDLKIFRSGLAHILEPGEKVIADGGYKGEPGIWAKGHDQLSKRARKVEGKIRARHETVNARLKNFCVLSTRFRHTLNLHAHCFYAVANLVQLAMKHEMPLFEVNYNEV